MAAKPKNKRNVKKEVVRLFEKSFDLEKLDYKKRSIPLKPKSAVVGLGVATLLYVIGFSLAYAAMGKNMLPLESFAKLVWIMMIPTTILGVFAWQIAKNRMEYPLRQDVREYMNELEENKGLLWKFSPLMDIIGIEDMNTKKALAKSREGKVDELDIEDYTEAVDKLNQLLEDTDARQFSTVIAENVLENFGKLPA